MIVRDAHHTSLFALAVFCATVALTAGQAGAGTPRRYATVTNAATKVSYEVAFGEKDTPIHRVTLWMNAPGTPEKRWRGYDVDAGFNGFTRIINGAFPTDGYSGVPWPSTRNFPIVPPKPGEKRRVEIVHNRDYLSVWLENDGRMMLFSRKKVMPGLRLDAVEFPRKCGVATNVAFAVADDAPDPTPVRLAVPAPAAGKVARFTLRPGLCPSFTTLTVDTGTTNRPTMAFSTFRQWVGGKAIDDSGLVWERRNDSRPLTVYTLPHLAGRYGEKRQAEMFKEIDRYGERATKHDFLFEIRRGVTGWALWIDESFFAKIPGTEAGFKGIRVDLPAGSAAKRLPDGREASDPMTLALGVRKPFDTSVCRCNLGNYDTECDGYLSRDAFEAHPDTFMRRVPADTYAAAIVRCRVDGAETNACELTARLTNFRCPNSEGRSPEAMTQPSVQLPRKDGEYTVRLDFEPGRIQDLIHDHPDGFLDLELMGGLDRADEFKVRPTYLPSPKRSGVTVLGVSLVRAPASLHVANGAYANTFVAGETAQVTADVRAVVGGMYRLAWTVTDLDGRTVEKKEKKLSLKAGASACERIAFVARDIGWYRYEVRLADAAGKTVVAYPGSFIIIAPDTRKAGYESPFFTWNRLGLRGTNEFRRIAAFLKRIGVRRTQLNRYTEEDAREFGLTLGTCYHCRWKRDGTRQEMMDSFERNVREAMAKWPHIDTALVYHEHRGGPAPQELVGGVTQLTAEDLAHQLDTAEGAIWRGEVWHKVAPQVKLQIGNSGSSLGLMGEVFRGKVPAHLFDTIGEESTGEAETPEKSVGWAFRNLQDLAAIYGYTNRAMACHEWKCRVPRLFYGNLRKHAAWRTRDSLIALVWGSRTVSVGSDADSGAGYFITCWGSGAMTREPLEQPYPVLAATANLTRVLDRCRFARLVPTGSKSVYLVEFRDPEGRYVYAGWTARGVVEAKLRTEAASLVVTDMFGREGRAPARPYAVTISEEPVYLTLDGPISSADATGRRSYPWEEHPELAGWKVLDPLASADAWTLETDKGWKPVYRRNRLLASRPGAFEFKTGTDEGRGCLSLTLKREGDLKPLVGECGHIRLKEPILVPEGATTIGVEVKGNSSWGKVYFEIEGANGARWRNCCTSFDGYGDNSDTLGINFDGWHRLASMIRNESPVKCASLDPNMRQWLRRGGKPKAKSEITYPVKLTAIYFELRRKTFDLLDWVDPDTDTILLRNFGAN